MHNSSKASQDALHIGFREMIKSRICSTFWNPFPRINGIDPRAETQDPIKSFEMKSFLDYNTSL